MKSLPPLMLPSCAWTASLTKIASSGGRARELADALGCKPGEIEALKDAEEQEARADD